MKKIKKLLWFLAGTSVFSLLFSLLLLPIAPIGTSYFPSFAFLTLFAIALKGAKDCFDRFVLSRQKEKQHRAEIMAFLATKVKLPCQVCNKDNFVNINLNSETYFNCEHCGSVHTVVVDLLPALVQKSEKSKDVVK